MLTRTRYGTVLIRMFLSVVLCTLLEHRLLSGVGSVTGNSDYLYLFLHNRSAFMIDRSPIQPDEAGLMELLRTKTGLAWTRNTSVLNTSLKSLREQRQNTKR